jgi:hypothetical protein
MVATVSADNGSVSGSAGIKLSSDSSGVLALQTGANSTAMTLDTSGNVGIGTSTPIAVLDVASGSNPAVRIRNTSTGGAGIWFVNSTSGTTTGDGSNVGIDSSQQLNLWNYENTATLFATNNTERMRIDSSGNLLVGKTSTGVSNQGFGVYSTGEIEANAGSNPAAYFNRTNDGTIMQFRRAGTTVGTISVSTGATAYNTSSDYRLKENIAPMIGALAKVAQLKPVIYKWKADGSDGEGFIAHELAEVVPHAVNGDKDAVDADGNPVYQGIDTSFLVATLTAALQETKALIDTQAETINALTARVVALEQA